ncbi:MAG: cysteine desulfurase [Candidatus Woesearchaeota archaeon]|nr:MAG: cysteine desulfurase [Candidatus Woesearchaeota archaeon]
MSLLDVKKDFPIFKQKVNGKPLVYLDSAATSQKPIDVLNTLEEYYKEYNSNVFRAIHTLGEKATEKYEEARKKVASFINSSPKEIIFTRNTTESINLVVRTWGKANIKKDDTILLTEMEHHSNLVPWLMLAKEQNAKISYIPITEEGLLDIKKSQELISKKPKILALTHISNVLGTINPIKELIQLAHRNNVAVLVDAAQSVPHMKVDVKDLDADFLAFSGHKMFGPTGIGVLFGKRKLLESIEPLYGGGEMIKEVFYTHATWNDVPHKFEAGTPHIAGAIGLGAAIDYLQKIGMQNIFEHNQKLTEYALNKLKQVKGIKIYGPLDSKLRNGVISFNLADIHPHDLSTVLDEEGIAIRSGHACAMPLHDKLGITASARVSFHVYNTFEDVDKLILALEKARKVFRL